MVATRVCRQVLNIEEGDARGESEGEEIELFLIHWKMVIRKYNREGGKCRSQVSAVLVPWNPRQSVQEDKKTQAYLHMYNLSVFQSNWSHFILKNID